MSPSHKFGELGMGGQKDDEVYPSVVKGAHRRGGRCTPLTVLIEANKAGPAASARALTGTHVR